MNNFTKSIVYSGVVLAAGLVAIFAIYNNVSSNSDVSYIEPAAGEEATITETVEHAADATGEAYDATAEAVEGAVEATGETVSDAIDAAKETAEDAGEAIEDAVTTAPAEEATETEPATGDELIEKAHEEMAE